MPATNPFQRIVEEIGVALMIAAASAIFVERLTHARLMNSIHDALDALRAGSDVLAGATSFSVCDIVSRRGADSIRYQKRLRDAIEKELEQDKGRIRILSVAAPELLRLDNTIAKEIKARIVRPGCNATIEALLLCPKSEYAVKRDILEPNHPTIPDIDHSIAQLTNLATQTNGRVQFKCYDLFPQMYLVLTGELLFIEPYPTYQAQEGPLGGDVPLLIITAESEIYAIWDKHFNYLWANHGCSHNEHQALNNM